MQWIKYIFIDNISGTCKYSVLFFKHLVDLLLIKPTNADPPPSNIAIKFCSKKKFSRGSMQLWDNHNHTFGVKIYPPPPHFYASIYGSDWTWQLYNKVNMINDSIIDVLTLTVFCLSHTGSVSSSLSTSISCGRTTSDVRVW